LINEFNPLDTGSKQAYHNNGRACRIEAASIARRIVLRKVTFIVVGAGCRGNNYSEYAKKFPDECQPVAVCEPDDIRRNKFGDEYGIPMESRYKDWREIVDLPKLADAAMVCTQDAGHKDPAVALADKGYHLLLEKPMAPTAEDCQEIYNAVKRNNVMLAVCHVLRYTRFNRKLKELIDSGLIGKVHNIQLVEPVGYWHQAHSYVRGNWRNEAESSFMLLAKSCHDLDLLNYFIPAKCSRVSSFGTLSYFTRENQPKGAADRCTECPAEIETGCPYSAIKIYLRDFRKYHATWPGTVLHHSGTIEGVAEALREGPYGRCVFACDNDVVDHQVVAFEFEDGTTATFTMSAFTFMYERQIWVMGDKGTLKWVPDGIEHCDFLTNKTTTISTEISDGSLASGHGGGDFGIMRNFIYAVRDNDPSWITSGPEVSLESHLMVFAAEKARRTGTVVEL